MSAWDQVPLGRVCRVVPGFAFKSKDWRTEGLPVLKIKNIRGDGTVDTSEVDCVPHDLMNKRMERFVLKDGDIILAMTGATAGKVGRLRSHSHYLLNQRVAKLEPVDIDPVFFWSLVSSDDYQNRFFRLADGAAQPNMSGSQIEGLSIPIPPKAIQRRIASILGAYDDLIEVNRRRVAVLEEMARGLFEEWFVRFRFPGHEEVAIAEAAGGPLPSDWSYVPLGSLLVCSIGGLWGQDSPSEITDQRVSVIRGTDFPKILTGRYTSVPDRFASDRELRPRLVWPGDIILEASGGSKDQPVGRALFMTASLIEKLEEPVAPASFCKLLRSADQDGLNYYLFGLLQAMYADGRIEKFQKQSTGLRNLSIRQLSLEEVISPSPAVLRAYGCAVAPLINLASIHRHERSTLAASRDLLLPRLISGQLSLKAAERELEEVA